MKKILKIICLVLIILIAGSNISESKIIGIYALEEFPQINPSKIIGISTFDSKDELLRTSISIYLEIYQNNVYKIVMTDIIQDREIVYDISFGNYKVINNILYLYDTYNKYEMQYLIKNKKLIPQRALNFLLGKPFKRYTNQDLESNTYDKTPYTSLNKSRANFAKSHKSKALLYYGTYGSVDDFNFVILSNHKYTMKFDNMVISEGSWKRKGNELICYDTNLKHNFYLSIGEKLIINRFFPCLYDNCDNYNTLLLQEIMIKAD
jgi:hypothetical protein